MVRRRSPRNVWTIRRRTGCSSSSALEPDLMSFSGCRAFVPILDSITKSGNNVNHDHDTDHSQHPLGPIHRPREARGPRRRHRRADRPDRLRLRCCRWRPPPRDSRCAGPRRGTCRFCPMRSDPMIESTEELRLDTATGQLGAASRSTGQPASVAVPSAPRGVRADRPRRQQPTDAICTRQPPPDRSRTGPTRHRHCPARQAGHRHERHLRSARGRDDDRPIDQRRPVLARAHPIRPPCRGSDRRRPQRRSTHLGCGCGCGRARLREYLGHRPAPLARSCAASSGANCPTT